VDEGEDEGGDDGDDDDDGERWLISHERSNEWLL
jgi:hypothetical protein